MRRLGRWLAALMRALDGRDLTVLAGLALVTAGLGTLLGWAVAAVVLGVVLLALALAPLLWPERPAGRRR